MREPRARRARGRRSLAARILHRVRGQVEGARQATPDALATPVEARTGGEAALAVDERVRLIRDGLVNYSGVLASGIVGIAVVPTMLHHLGIERYGLWIAVLAVAAVVGEVDCGLGTVVTRELSADPQCKREETAALLSAAASAYLALAVAGGLVVGFLGLAVAHGARGATPFIFAMVAVISFSSRLLAFSIALLYGLRRFARANVLTTAGAVAAGLGTVAVLLAGGGLRAVAAWQAASASIVGAAAVVTAVRLRPEARPRLGQRLWRSLRGQLHFGVASQILTSSVNLIWLAAPALVGSVLSARSVTPYDLGRKFPVAVSTISWRSSEAFFPSASRANRVGDLRQGQEIVRAVMRWNLVLALPLSIVLWLLAPNLLSVWIGAPPPHALSILRLLTAAVLVDSIGAGALQVLWAEGRVRPLLGVLAATTLTGLGLAVALLWQLGVTGIALAIVSVTVVRSALLVHALCREHALTISSLLCGAGVGLVVPVGVCALATFALREAIAPENWGTLVAVGLAGLLVYLLTLSLGYAREEERVVLRSAIAIPRRAGEALWTRTRRALRRIGPLRSGWYLARELARMAGPGARPTASYLDREFAAKVDPWDYHRASEHDRHMLALELLDGARGGALFPRAVEVGCAEGMFTELLARRCEKLLAVDISAVALDRARSRCADCAQITFQQWDLLDGAALGVFDLMLSMDVLDYMVRPTDFRRARSRIYAMLAPEGHLLVTTTKQSEVYASAWWRRWILRGATIHEAFASHPGIRVVARRETETHALALYLRSSD